MDNKNYNLLIETSNEIEVVTESTDNGKKLFIEGIMAQAEVVNGNKRLYSRDILENGISKYDQDYIQKRRAFGEINHPEYPMPDMKEAAIRVTNMRMEGINATGKALVLPTPNGQILKGLIEGGAAVGVSTRALGSLREDKNGIKHVQEFLMTALDCVDNPSGPDCYVDHFRENTQWRINESTGHWVPIEDRSRNDHDNQELFLERLSAFVSGIKFDKDR